MAPLEKQNFFWGNLVHLVFLLMLLHSSEVASGQGGGSGHYGGTKLKVQKI